MLKDLFSNRLGVNAFPRARVVPKQYVCGLLLRPIDFLLLTVVSWVPLDLAVATWQALTSRRSE